MVKQVLSTLSVIVLLALGGCAEEVDSDAGTTIQSTSTTTEAVSENASPQQVLINMFRWWNEAYHDEEDGFTAETFARYYTEDSVMLINGDRRGTGPAELAAHFRNIQANSDEVEIVLPFLEGFSSGNKTFTSHHVRARRDGEESWERVMGYAVIRDGRIALIDFVGIPADAP